MSVVVKPPSRLSNIEAQIFVARFARNVASGVNEIRWESGLRDIARPCPEHWAPSGWVFVGHDPLRGHVYHRRAEELHDDVTIEWFTEAPEDYSGGGWVLVYAYRRCLIMFYYSRTLSAWMRVLWTPIMIVRRMVIESDGMARGRFRVCRVSDTDAGIAKIADHWRGQAGRAMRREDMEADGAHAGMSSVGTSPRKSQFVFQSNVGGPP